MKSHLFFGASTGRTATMHLANCLNSESDCTCVHEGKFRHRESSGEQLLPFLTLENRIAYEHPERAADIIASKRGILDDMDTGGSTHFGDIAYNYSPFLLPLSRRFPEAKFVILVRDGRGFVRSATVLEREDETPVGWPPADKVLSKMERYISLGRLQPRQGSDEAPLWVDWDAVDKNTWLWAETNRVILQALAVINPDRWLLVRFEDFVSDSLGTYKTIRRFLGFEPELSDSVKEVLLSPVVNARRVHDIPPFKEWSEARQAHFQRYAGHIMNQLGYIYE